jgi:hypothetical protein
VPFLAGVFGEGKAVRVVFAGFWVVSGSALALFKGLDVLLFVGSVAARFNSGFEAGAADGFDPAGQAITNPVSTAEFAARPLVCAEAVEFTAGFVTAGVEREAGGWGLLAKVLFFRASAVFEAGSGEFVTGVPFFCVGVEVIEVEVALRLTSEEAAGGKEKAYWMSGMAKRADSMILPVIVKLVYRRRVGRGLEFGQRTGFSNAALVAFCARRVSFLAQ